MKRTLLHRRKFLTTSCSATASLVFGRVARAAQPIVAQSAPVPLHIDTSTSAAGRLISPDFIGLSYENMQLEDPSFFSPRNTGLIEQFKSISPRGVLRLGGNTSEFSWWQSDPSQPPPRTQARPQRRLPPSKHPLRHHPPNHPRARRLPSGRRLDLHLRLEPRLRFTRHRHPRSPVRLRRPLDPACSTFRSVTRSISSSSTTSATAPPGPPTSIYSSGCTIAQAVQKALPRRPFRPARRRL